MLLRLKAITCLMRSTGSVSLAAAVRYWGAEAQKSTIRWMEDRGSNILIGREMCEIDSPLRRTRISYFATWVSTPYYFFRASSSVQTS